MSNINIIHVVSNLVLIWQFDKEWWHVPIEPLIEIPSVKHFFVLENMERDKLNNEHWNFDIVWWQVLIEQPLIEFPSVKHAIIKNGVVQSAVVQRWVMVML